MENTRRKFTPQQGKVYKLHTTRRGGESAYICTGTACEGAASMQNTRSGWLCFAHGCGIYPDGTIDWDYSTGGRFVEPLTVNGTEKERLYL